MNRCCKCREKLKNDDNAITCSECEFRFHGAICSGMSETTFASKRGSTKKAWKCEACKRGKGDASNGDSNTDPDLKVLIVEMNRKLTSLLPLTEKLDAVESSIQMLHEEFATIKERLDTQDKEIKGIKGRIGKLERDAGSKDITQLQLSVHDLEWRSRRLNIEIHGIPEAAGEDLLSKVNEVADKIGMNHLTEADTLALHRMSAKPGKTKGVIARFVRQELRDAWLQKRVVLKEKGDSVYITENMTNYSRVLLQATKEWAKQAGFAYVWHVNGKILVRRRSGDGAKVIKSVSDLSTLVS